jgi:hypothetical protein
VAWLPKLAIAGLTPQQKGKLDRIGGAPLGLPADKWPRCEKRPLTFVGQLQHARGRLDLGGAHRVVYAFLCERHGDGVAVMHEMKGKLAPQEEPLTPSFVELAVLAWRKANDPPREPHDGPKIGGAPDWVQQGKLPAGSRYVAQWPPWKIDPLPVTPAARITLRGWIAKNARGCRSERVPERTGVYGTVRPVALTSHPGQGAAYMDLCVQLDRSTVKLRPNGKAMVYALESGTVYLIKKGRDFEVLYIGR